MSRILLSGFYKNSQLTVSQYGNVSRYLSSSSALRSSNDGEAKKGGFLSPESSIASPSFKNRWGMFVPAFATHVCLGAPYGNFYKIDFVENLKEKVGNLRSCFSYVNPRFNFQLSMFLVFQYELYSKGAKTSLETLIFSLLNE